MYYSCRFDQGCCDKYGILVEVLYRELFAIVQRTIRYNCELRGYTISKIKDDQ